jgi:hypothetical protein
MDGDTVRAGGGFRDPLPDASPRLRAQIQATDAAYAKQAALEEQQAAFRLDEARQQAIVTSIRMAEDRGEVVDMRQALRDGGVGRTKAEAVEYFSACADLDDARQAGAWRKRMA